MEATKLAKKMKNMSTPKRQKATPTVVELPKMSRTTQDHTRAATTQTSLLKVRTYVKKTKPSGDPIDIPGPSQTITYIAGGVR